MQLTINYRTCDDRSVVTRGLNSKELNIILDTIHTYIRRQGLPLPDYKIKLKVKDYYTGTKMESKSCVLGRHGTPI